MHVRGLSDAAGRTENAETCRSGERTHLFLDATMVLGATSERVRVRNLSPTGALIEGPMHPSIGAAVTLHRGALTVAGRTMWVGPGRCGIQFDATLAVADWMPLKAASRHSPEASANRIPHAPNALPFDPTLLALVREAVAPEGGTAPLATAAESGLTQTAQALEELLSLQSDMNAALNQLKRRDVDNYAGPEALATAIRRIDGIVVTLRNV